jgi:hypothetical protein
VKASKAFIEDFEYLTGLYKWDAEEIAEMKEWIRSDQAETVPYITSLALQWKTAEGLIPRTAQEPA